MNLKDNAKKGIYSTVVGSIIVLSAIVSVFVVKEVTWAQATAALTIGLGLIGFGKK